MPTVLQQLWSPMERAFAAREAEPASRACEDDIVLGCECADPSLQFEGWEPLEAHGATAAPGY